MGARVVHDRAVGQVRLQLLLEKLGGEKPVVTVGLREEHGDDPDSDDDLTLAEVAIVNEFGCEDGHVPERAAWRNSWAENLDKYQDGADVLVGEVVDRGGTADAFKVGLLQLGYEVVGDLQQAITDFDDPANAEATVAAKGFDNPLIHTGRTRQTIDAELDDGRNVQRARGVD